MSQNIEANITVPTVQKPIPTSDELCRNRRSAWAEQKGFNLFEEPAEKPVLNFLQIEIDPEPLQIDLSIAPKHRPFPKIGATALMIGGGVFASASLRMFDEYYKAEWNFVPSLNNLGLTVEMGFAVFALTVGFWVLYSQYDNAGNASPAELQPKN